MSIARSGADVGIVGHVPSPAEGTTLPSVARVRRQIGALCAVAIAGGTVSRTLSSAWWRVGLASLGALLGAFVAVKAVDAFQDEPHVERKLRALLAAAVITIYASLVETETSTALGAVVLGVVVTVILFAYERSTRALVERPSFTIVGDRRFLDLAVATLDTDGQSIAATMTTEHFVSWARSRAAAPTLSDSAFGELDLLVDPAVYPVLVASCPETVHRARRVVLGCLGVPPAKSMSVRIGQLAGIEAVADPLPPLCRALKRTIDLVGASVVLLVTSPVLIVASLAIRFDSRGPVVFRQTRLGRDSKPFTMFKLRTMKTENDDSEHRRYVASMITGAAARRQPACTSSSPTHGSRESVRCSESSASTSFRNSSTSSAAT